MIALHELIAKALTKEKEAAKIEFKNLLDEAITLQNSFAEERDSAIQEMENFKERMENAEKQEFLAQTKAEEAQHKGLPVAFRSQRC